MMQRTMRLDQPCIWPVALLELDLAMLAVIFRKYTLKVALFCISMSLDVDTASRCILLPMG